ncbi:ScbA/BarX family gamma-butyrolactone biosynthesis protein [Kitasatospora cineracea]|uniref:ScbA/BarX family gamma-butyrolactone biosynthesis protein n=1 Tax=Kitasatospora cineracea TaxID=88074 RepID=UPI00381E0038
MVHRAAVAEVFLTDAVRVGEDRFLVAAQWPRDHALYHPDRAGVSDPMLFAETIRQTLVYLAHEFHGVPLSHRFIGGDMDFEITDPEALRVGAAPVPVVLETRWAFEGAWTPKRYGMRIEAVLTVDGRPCGRGSLRVVAVDERRYGLLRGRSDAMGAALSRALLPPEDYGVHRMPPAAVGRLRAKDSVLARGAGAGEWGLELDLDHAILFDHPSDHAPLMALLEGFRQLGHHLALGAGGRGRPAWEAAADLAAGPDAAAPPRLLSLTTACLAFGELDRPIRLVVREDRPDQARPGVRRLGIDAVQGDCTLAASTAHWSLPAAPGLAVHRELRRGHQQVPHVLNAR